MTLQPVRKRAGFSLMELLVVMGIASAAAALLIPAVGKAQQSMQLSGDRNNSAAVGSAILAYAADHRQVMPYDGRKSKDGRPTVDRAPSTYEAREASWFGRLEAGYLNGNYKTLDCPVVDDHRKVGASIAYRPPWVWPTDYVMNAMALNVSVELADQPSQNVLVAEPNAPRGTVTVIAHVVAFEDWGYADRLEQNVAGSLTFCFVDGHAARIRIPAMKQARYAAYPELALAANPPTDFGLVYSNTFCISRSQLGPNNQAILPSQRRPR